MRQERQQNSKMSKTARQARQDNETSKTDKTARQQDKTVSRVHAGVLIKCGKFFQIVRDFGSKLYGGNVDCVVNYAGIFGLNFA